MCECHSEGAPATEESGFYSRTLSVVSCLLLTKDKSKTVGTHGWKLFVTLDWLWPVVADVSFVTSLLEKSVPKHLFIKNQGLQSRKQMPRRWPADWRTYLCDATTRKQSFAANGVYFITSARPILL